MNKITVFYLHLLQDYNMESSVFNYIEDKSVNINTDKGTVSFDFFIEKDTRRGMVYTHIFYNKNANAITTSRYLKENNERLFNTNVFIYLSRSKSNSSSIKDSISKIIKYQHIDFVEDILKKISISKNSVNFNPVEYDTPKVFINPTISEIEDFDNIQAATRFQADLEFINSWYENDNSPVLVLLGKAGIGKTTISQYFSNIITSRNKNTTNIFINSVEVKKRLIEDFKESSNINLYDIYKSSMKNQNFLDAKYFKYNLDTGNIFLIIDGIDELISKVNNFELSDFLASVEAYNQQIKNSKIIITCRSEYWENIDFEVKLISLFPFDIEQTENFFKESFKKEKTDTKYNKAIFMAKDFHKNNEGNDNIYHPYALDLITKIINDDALLNDNPKTKILNTKYSTDYIIAKMCYRENYLLGRSRITNLTIDEQVKIFQYFSIINNGGISINDFDEAVYFGINKNIDNSQDFETTKLTKSFSSHPLFVKKDNKIRFAYDFLIDFFKATYLAYYLDYEDLTEIKDDFLKILEDCSFSSQITKDIAIRVGCLGDKEILNLQFLLEIIMNSQFDLKKRINLYSGVFNIAFEINKESLGKIESNKIENTILLKRLYGEVNIKNLCLININDKLEFDFTGIEFFENCHFNKYLSFWDNTDSTINKFHNCSFYELGQKRSKRTLKWKLDLNYTNFDFNSQSSFNRNTNVGMDKEFVDQFNKTTGKDKFMRDEITKLVSKFIHFFWHSNHLQSQNYDISDSACKYPFILKYSSFSTLLLDYEFFLETLEDIGIIEWSTFQGIRKINISKDYRPEISEHILQGSFSKILKELEDILYEELR